MTKLEKILKYVSEHNEFYKNRIKEYGIKDPLDITQWPVLTRKELQENRYNMFSDGYKNKYYWQQLIRKTSSGSSGIPVNVYWDYSDYYSTVKTLWHRRLLHYGIRANDKKIYISTNMPIQDNREMRIKYTTESHNILNVQMPSGQEDFCQELIQIIYDFQPVWIYLRPYILQKLLYYYKVNNRFLPSSVVYIESYGEMLSSYLQKDASEYFNIPIANMYGSEEINTIAYECQYHHMHILTDNNYEECYQNNLFYSNGTCEAIITSLKNKAMPLIRYQQYDDITISNNIAVPCLCGSIDPVIDVVKGRSLDKIVVDNNTELNSLLFLEIMGKINNQYNGLIKYYKYQYSESRQHLQCYLSIDTKNTNWYSSIKTAIETELNKFLLDKNISFQVSLLDKVCLISEKHRVFEIVE